mgnify:CR=1 FL=1
MTAPVVMSYEEKGGPEPRLQMKAMGFLYGSTATGRTGTDGSVEVSDTEPLATVAVATGELNAQEAFIGGRIRLFGDQQKLLESQPVFGALDAVFATVRERTSYS